MPRDAVIRRCALVSVPQQESPLQWPLPSLAPSSPPLLAWHVGTYIHVVLHVSLFGTAVLPLPLLHVSRSRRGGSSSAELSRPLDFMKVEKGSAVLRESVLGEVGVVGEVGVGRWLGLSGTHGCAERGKCTDCGDWKRGGVHAAANLGGQGRASWHARHRPPPTRCTPTPSRSRRCSLSLNNGIHLRFRCRRCASRRRYPRHLGGGRRGLYAAGFEHDDWLLAAVDGRFAANPWRGRRVSARTPRSLPGRTGCGIARYGEIVGHVPK